MRSGKLGLNLIFIIVPAIILAIQPSSAEIIEVCDNCDFSTIQSAIDASNEGDTILVASGTYKENLRISKSVSIMGSEKTILEPKIVILPVVQVSSVSGFGLENIRINNASTGLEITLLGNFSIENCTFMGNLHAISIRDSREGNIEGLRIEGFGSGVAIESSKHINLSHSILKNGNIGVKAVTSSELVFSDIVIKDVEMGIELYGGEQNQVESTTFSGNVFISSLSEEGFLVSDSVAEKGVFASDNSLGSVYVFKGLNVSGERFQISVAGILLPEGFVQLSDAINATITPDIHTEVGYVFLKPNLGKEIRRPVNASAFNTSTIAFYRLDGMKLNRVSDHYNSSSAIPLSSISNISGIYVLAAEKIRHEKPTSTPILTPTPPTLTPTSEPIEQPKIPGFEALLALIGILSGMLTLRAKEK